MSDDLEVINAFMREAAAKAVADVIREQTALAQGMPSVDRDPSQYVVDNVGRRPSTPARQYNAPRYATVRPIETDSLPGRPDMRLAKYLGIGAGLGVLVALIWGAVILITALITATVSAVISVLPLLAVVGIVIVLLMLGGRGGGHSGSGRGDFSGTFKGWMH
jgi:hypothetical protein